MTQTHSLPDFIVIGPFKSGTTWIYDYFADRGDICLPKGVKETFFFDRNFDRGLGWYQAHFANFDAVRHRACCEVAPSYAAAASACDAIYQSLGALPVVMIRRDPVGRSWSHYLHMRRKGYTLAPLEKAVEEHPSILDASRLSRLLPVWEGRFGAENVIVLSFEELKHDPVTFAATLCDRLGLPPRAPEGKRLGASNVAGMSRSGRLAGVARRSTEILRRHRLHRIVNAGKALGLHELIYSGKDMARDPTLIFDESARMFLSNALANEYDGSYDYVRPSSYAP